MSEYTSIRYARDERVARVTFNRPDKRNAMDLTLRGELVDALRRAERDDRISVVAIDGAGPAFCSGYDMSADARHVPDGGYVSPLFDDWTDQFARHAVRDWLVIWDLLKPVVCKVHGSCLAGGTEVMSLCDMAFVADDARIGYPAMRAQSTPDAAFFAWKMTMARAKYLQLSGNIISGRTAAEWGWVTKSFAAADLDAEFDKELQALASIAPDLLAANKLAINQSYEMMGFRTALMAATSWHFVSAKVRPNAGEFQRMVKAEGLKAAVQWRDGPFKDLKE